MCIIWLLTHRLLLLNKLLEDGNTLFKKGSLSDACHRYQYALRRLPASFAGQHRPIFEQLQVHLLLNLCRCKRKAGLFDEAVELAEKVLNVSVDNKGILLANIEGFRVHYLFPMILFFRPVL